jgi:hypothetical protein
MEDTSGFYKFDDEQQEWYYGPNAVYGPTFTLLRELHDTYTYPVEGWVWYDQQPLGYIN